MTAFEDSTYDADAPDGDMIAATAVRLAALRGWRSLTLGEIAAEAGVTLVDLSRRYSCRPDILDGFERMMDRGMLAQVIIGETEEKPRDRLFDIIMERFETLSHFRDGVRRIARELPFDPASGLVLATAMPRSAAWMFAGAGMSVDGPLMPMKIMALSGLYLSVFRIWLRDESQDLGKTMAALDSTLDRAGILFGGKFEASRSAPPRQKATEPDSPQEPSESDSAQVS